MRELRASTAETCNAEEARLSSFHLESILPTSSRFRSL